MAYAADLFFVYCMKGTIYSMIEKVQTKDGKGIYYDSLGY